MSTTGTVTVRSGLRLSYAERGPADGLVALLLPGPTDSWRSYEPVLRHVPDEIHAIAVSPRGHGDSDKPDHGYTVDDFAGDAVALLDALAIDRAVIAGHSGSCLTARRVALDHPERVAGLVLEASPTTLRFGAASEFVNDVVAGLADPIDPAFVRSFVADTSSVQLPPEIVDGLVAEVLKVPARVWHETFAALLAYDDLGELERIDAPTLLIWGDDDGLVPREMQDDLTQRIPHAELLIYPGSGHTPRWDDPERFSHDLATFAHRVSPARLERGDA